MIIVKKWNDKMICFCKKNMIEITIKNKTYYKCDCGYLKKKDILSNELQKKRYDNHVCDNYYIDYMNKIYNNIKPYLYNNKMLDYGCGKIHALADILNNNGYDCKYYDLFYYDFDYYNYKYDTIILIEVFEHIEEPLDLLINLKKLLNNFGRIIIHTMPIPTTNLDKWWYLNDSTHVSFFNYNCMKVLADLVGFSLEYDEINSIFILSSIE